MADCAVVALEDPDGAGAAAAGVLVLADGALVVTDVGVPDVAVADVDVPDVDVPDVDVPDVAVGVDPAPDVDAACVSAGPRRTSATVPVNVRSPIDSISKRT